jgi:hypothetical protein
MLTKTVSITSFVLRHFVASIMSITVPAAIWIITYFVLFIIALVTNSGLGGLAALPFWTVVIYVISVLYTAILLFPSAFLAEAIARVFGKWQLVAQIPISISVLFILVHALRLLVHRHPDCSEIEILHWANYPLAVSLILTIPLGIYWWTLKFVQAGFTLPVILYRRLRKSKASKNEAEQT